MNIGLLHLPATDENIYFSWCLCKEQQLESTGVGPPSYTKSGLNVGDGMFNLRVHGLICYKNVRLKVIQPQISLLTEEPLWKLVKDTREAASGLYSSSWLAWNMALAHVVASSWWLICSTVNFFSWTTETFLFTYKCLCTAAVCPFIYLEITVFVELHPRGYFYTHFIVNSGDYNYYCYLCSQICAM